MKQIRAVKAGLTTVPENAQDVAEYLKDNPHWQMATDQEKGEFTRAILSRLEKAKHGHSPELTTHIRMLEVPAALEEHVMGNRRMQAFLDKVAPRTLIDRAEKTAESLAR